MPLCMEKPLISKFKLDLTCSGLSLNYPLSATEPLPFGAALKLSGMEKLTFDKLIDWRINYEENANQNFANGCYSHFYLGHRTGLVHRHYPYLGTIN